MNGPALWLGASWYPELWPEAEWPRDLARMRTLGFSVVRVFEFAWHRFEPAAGEYDFAWARRLLDLCRDHGIAVVIGTPTAAPPAWLTESHPDVLRTRADGTRVGHGMRRHYNPHSRTYRRLARDIVVRMCEAFAEHPSVVGWQIDNEMSGFDYGDETHRQFHAWLERRFGTVEALNRAWGLEFWSQAYGRFDQVPLCTAEVGSVEVPERHHPSLILAIARFQNEGWTAFISEQAAVIRRFSRAPVTTNMTGLVGGMAWERHFRELDVAGASMYADRRYYHYNLPRFDRLRAEKAGRPYWLLETAPNWSAGGRTWNIHYDERGVRLFTWLSVFLGGEMVLYWQWREHPAGQEMLHGTCVTASGRWRPNHAVWKELGEGFRTHGPWLAAHPPAPARLALVMSSEASWAFSVDPTDEDMRYEARFRDTVYLPLTQAQLWRDVVSEDADLTPYRVVCMPLQPFARPAALARLKAWVEAGGTLILGPLSCFRSEEFTVPHPREFGGFEDLMGGESALRFTAQWVEDRVGVEFERHGTTRTKTLCEAFTPGPGCAVLARYRGGYGDGLPAALDRRYGRGRVITLGCIVDEAVWTAIVGEACSERGIEPLAAVEPAGARAVVVPRAGTDGAVAGYALANLEEREVRVRLPCGGRDLLSGEDCGPEVTLSPFQARLVVGLPIAGPR